MSKTRRCIDCPIGGEAEDPNRGEQWEDEICSACGRCVLHCTANEDAPHDLQFDVQAKLDTDRPHPDAGRARKLTAFTPNREDKDRARPPI